MKITKKWLNFDPLGPCKIHKNWAINMKFSEIVENYEFSNLSRFNHLEVLKTAKKNW